MVTLSVKVKSQWNFIFINNNSNLWQISKRKYQWKFCKKTHRQSAHPPIKLAANIYTSTVFLSVSSSCHLLHFPDTHDSTWLFLSSFCLETEHLHNYTIDTTSTYIHSSPYSNIELSQWVLILLLCYVNQMIKQLIWGASIHCTAVTIRALYRCVVLSE